MTPSRFKRGNKMEIVALVIIGCLAVFLTMFMAQILVVLVSIFAIVIMNIIRKEE